MFRLKRNAMDISIVAVVKMRKDVLESHAVSINFDVQMEIVASMLHSSAITKMIAVIIPMKPLVVS